MKERFKYILAVSCLVILLLPWLNYQTELFKTEPLEGDITIAQKPEFKKEDYWSLKWQDDYNKYINDNFGFRSFFVRLINQVRFSVFNTTKAPGVVIGNDGELFIESYINDYIGRNYLGKSVLNATAYKIKALQDSLKARNTDLIVVFAPGKASFYPEKIPANYMRKAHDSTNYKVYAQLFNDYKINFIDLNAWFSQQKNKFKYKVYPKYGTHWNHYGMTLALDSILHYIEKKRNIDIPDFDYSLVNYDSDLRGNDYDIGILTNLLFPLKKDVNPYPVFKYKDKKDSYKPNTLVVGDSYWWCIVGDNMPVHFFSEDEYWFYNKDVLIKNSKQEKPANKRNISSELAKRDVVMLIATEATYYMFPYGFVEKAYKLKCEDHSKRYKEIYDNMRTHTDWMQQMQDKAKASWISLEEQMRRDAEYIICDEILKPRPDIEAAIKEIKDSPKWMEEVRKKAIENNISVEQQIIKDAEWAANQ